MSHPRPELDREPRQPWLLDGPGAVDALAAHVQACAAARPETAVFAFRVGVQPRGTDPDRLGYRLLAWLREVGGHEEPLPTTPAAIAERVPNWLARAASARPLLVAIAGPARLRADGQGGWPHWWLDWRPPRASIVLADDDAGFAERFQAGGGHVLRVDAAATTPWPAAADAVEGAEGALIDAGWALADAGRTAELRALLCEAGQLPLLESTALRYDAHRWLRTLAPAFGGADGLLAPLRESIQALPPAAQAPAWLAAARLVAAVDDQADTGRWIAPALALDAHAPATALAEGTRLIAQGRHEQAAALAEAALRHGGPDAREAAALEHLRAVAAESLGDLSTAQTLYTQALKAAEDQHGPHAAGLLPHLANLAGVLQARQDPAAAKPWRERAADVARRVHGNADPRTAAALDALGGVAYGMGDAAAAARHYRDALRVAEAAFGPAHPATAAALSNLGAALDAQSDFAEAEAVHRRALAIREARHGRVHEDSAASRHNLASVLDQRGRLDEAEALYREAIEDWRQLVGDGHPATATSRNNLADLLAGRGALAEAAALYRDNLHTFSQRYGERHPHAILSQTELGACLGRLGQAAEAEALLREAVTLSAEVLGETSLGHVDALCKLAVTLRESGRGDAARTLLDDALAALEPKLGVISPRMLRLKKQREALDAPPPQLH